MVFSLRFEALECYFCGTVIRRGRSRSSDSSFFGAVVASLTPVHLYFSSLRSSRSATFK